MVPVILKTACGCYSDTPHFLEEGARFMLVAVAPRIDPASLTEGLLDSMTDITIRRFTWEGNWRSGCRVFEELL